MNAHNLHIVFKNDKILTRNFFYLGVCIAQNGPGITNFVTGVAAAYWAHSPVVVITPETGSLTNGLGGFQETNQVCTYVES